MRIGVTDDAADLDAMFRLRGAEVIERGWGAAGSMPAGRERDEYDDHAVHIAIRDGAEIVGTCRLLLPSTQRLLPIERDFDLRLEPRGGVVQWGRLVLAHRHRGDPQHRLAVACLAALWLETTRRGYQACAGVVARPVLDMYRQMGIDFQLLGPPRVVEGEQRYPAVSSAATIRTALEVMRRFL